MSEVRILSRVRRSPDPPSGRIGAFFFVSPRQASVSSFRMRFAESSKVNTTSRSKPGAHSPQFASKQHPALRRRSPAISRSLHHRDSESPSYSLVTSIGWYGPGHQCFAEWYDLVIRFLRNRPGLVSSAKAARQSELESDDGESYLIRCRPEVTPRRHRPGRGNRGSASPRRAIDANAVWQPN